MQDIKMNWKSCDFMKVFLRDCYKAYNDKTNKNVQRGFQEEDY